MAETMDFVVYEDEHGIYFNAVDTQTKKVRKIRPEDLGFHKKIEASIVVRKKVSNAEGLTDEDVYFSLPISYEFPQDEPRKWKYAYFYKCRSGEIALRDFSNGATDINFINSGLVVRGTAKKLPENTQLPLSTPIYELDPSTNELRRFVRAKDPITISNQ
jgi:hypothetical protein